MKRIFALLLAIALLLCGCAGDEKPQAEATQPTQVTEPQPTEPEGIITQIALEEALAKDGRATLAADLQLTKEVIVNGQVLDGGGFTVTGPKYNQEDPTTENAITVAGGTVENVTVKGAYRGIGDNKNNRADGDVRLKNVTVDSDTNVLNFGYGNGEGGLHVENSTLTGWTSYTKFKEALFTNCTFGWCESGANGNLRPYINTTLVGCKFLAKTEADGAQTLFNLNFKSGTDGVLLILEDCYAGDTLITKDNINDLLNVNAYGNTVEVRNTAN